MKPRIAITAGDPAGIGPEIARVRPPMPRVRDVCEPIVYGAPAGQTFAVGELSAEAGRAAHDVDRACGGGCAAWRDRRDGNGADQQGSVSPGRA